MVGMRATFSTRRSCYGGGIASGGALTLVVRGNSAAFAGGIDSSGTLEIANSEFVGNHDVYRAGAVYNAGSMSVSRSLFTGNLHGAISNTWQGGVTIAASNFSVNVGGGIVHFGNLLTVSHSTFTSNDGIAISVSCDCNLVLLNDRARFWDTLVNSTCV